MFADDLITRGSHNMFSVAAARIVVIIIYKHCVSRQVQAHMSTGSKFRRIRQQYAASSAASQTHCTHKRERGRKRAAAETHGVGIGIPAAAPLACLLQCLQNLVAYKC